MKDMAELLEWLDKEIKKIIDNNHYRQDSYSEGYLDALDLVYQVIKEKN